MFIKSRRQTIPRGIMVAVRDRNHGFVLAVPVVIAAGGAFIAVGLLAFSSNLPFGVLLILMGLILGARGAHPA